MQSEDSSEVERLLSGVQRGDPAATSALVEVLRSELHAVAGHLMSRQAPGHTLQATALVNEMFLRLSTERGFVAESRAHFLAIAARSMRQILSRHAMDRRALKRGGAFGRVSFSEAPAALENEDHTLDLDAALAKLEALNPRQAQVVEMRFFADMTIEEIAEALSVGTATVERDWRMARAWMRAELSREGVREEPSGS